MQRIVLGSEPGIVLHVLDLGATVHRLEVTGGDGVRRNVVPGHDDPEEGLRSRHYLGSTIGRFANRIARGRFVLDGREISLPVNDRGHHLHGGPDGFDKRTWEVKECSSNQAVLTLRSPDGDQGYPGALDAHARFTVGERTVSIELSARTDAPTVVNLTNHAYFNLAGVASGPVDEHLLQVFADGFTPVDACGIPTGDDLPVAGTPFDLRDPVPLSTALSSGDSQIRTAGGLDHNFVLRGIGMRHAATLTCRRTQTSMELRTDQPGLQVYTANSFDGSPLANGHWLGPWDAIALEPQLPLDAPTRSPERAVLRPGETYRSNLRWDFFGL